MTAIKINLPFSQDYKWCICSGCLSSFASLDNIWQLKINNWIHFSFQFFYKFLCMRHLIFSFYICFSVFNFEIRTIKNPPGNKIKLYPLWNIDIGITSHYLITLVLLSSLFIFVDKYQHSTYNIIHRNVEKKVFSTPRPIY